MTSPGSGEDTESMSVIVDSLRATFFTIRAGDEDEPETRVATREVTDYRDSILKHNTNKDKKKAELVEEMTKRASDAVKRRLKQEQLANKVIFAKRKGSQPFPLGEAVLAKMLREVGKDVGIQAQINVKEAELDKLCNL
jgi:hypothetical protein